MNKRLKDRADDMALQRRASSCDVMLLLEGTFPYVSGGVSSWVNQIIRGFPELRFGVCFLGSRRQDYGDAKYGLPDNVEHLETHFLHEPGAAGPARPAAGHADSFQQMHRLHQQLRRPARGDGRWWRSPISP